MRTRLLITAAALALVASLPNGPALAEERPVGSGGAYVDPTGDPTAVASERTSRAGAGGGGSADPCRWDVVIEDDTLVAVYAADSATPLHSTTGRWLQKVCPGQGAVALDGRFVVPEGGLVDPLALAQDALSRVGIDGPTIRTSPMNQRLVVHVPTWLWIDIGWWRAYQATASAGRVSSTVTARPVSVLWEFGDGSGTVQCSGPGRPWVAGAPENGSDCTHTYTSSSAGHPEGTFEMSAIVTFELTWTSTLGVGGALAPITRSSTERVEVGEIQAIGSR